MALTAGVGLPSHAVREQILQAVDVMVHMERTAGGERRVAEVACMEREEGSRPHLRRVTMSAVESPRGETGGSGTVASLPLRVPREEVTAPPLAAPRP